MATQQAYHPIFTTRGDVGGFLVEPYIYNLQGEWIGWITPERKVYSVHGMYVGWMTPDPRILRKRAESYAEPRMAPPARPPRFRPPASVPLAPLMSELTHSILDVFDEQDDLLPTVDFGEERLDMD